MVSIASIQSRLKKLEKAVIKTGIPSEQEFWERWSGFDEMSKLNTYMLKFIYPDKWKDLTYNVEMDPELNPDLNKEMKAKYIKTDLNSLPGM